MGERPLPAAVLGLVLFLSSCFYGPQGWTTEGDVALWGDSILDSAVDELTPLLSSHQASATARPGATTLDFVEDPGDIAPIVVVELSTNDWFWYLAGAGTLEDWTLSLNTLLNTIPLESCGVAYVPYAGRAWSLPIISAHPHVDVVVDWGGTVDPSWQIDEGGHLNQAGQDALAADITARIEAGCDPAS